MGETRYTAIEKHRRKLYCHVIAYVAEYGQNVPAGMTASHIYGNGRCWKPGHVVVAHDAPKRLESADSVTDLCQTAKKGEDHGRLL